MEWSDDAIVLSARKHGETAAIAMLLTAAHGRHAGLVRGGGGRRAQALLQPGTVVRAHWQARLEDHLGAWRLEPVASPAAGALDDARALAILAASCAMAETALPEREAHAAVHAGLRALLSDLGGADAAAAYVRWEVALLADLGYGLDLARCAATGRDDALAYVSPRTGRAVSLAAGEPYRERLLALPGFLLAGGGEGAAISDDAVAAGLALTGHFLETHALAPRGASLPQARRRLAERFARPR